MLEGSSIHSRFVFEKATPVTAHLQVGNLRLQETHLLETGTTVPIVSGTEFIHALFHLDTPSLTVVVRTHNDPGTGPQFTYLPPHLAVDPFHHDALTTRRKQLLDVLEKIDDPSYGDLALEMIAQLDFERGFFILQNGVGPLRGLGQWDEALATFQQKHGVLAKGVAATLDEIVRRDGLAALRSTIDEVEHRFFLALLLNVTDRAAFLKMVAQRFPGRPEQTILRWARELAEATGGEWLVDAPFPAELDLPEEVRVEAFVAALAERLGGAKAKKNPFPKSVLTALQKALVNSSWRVLVK